MTFGPLLTLLTALAMPQAPSGTVTVEQALEIMHQHLPAIRQSQAAAAQFRAIHEETTAAWYPSATVSLGYRRTTANLQPAAGVTSAEALTGSTTTFNTYNSFTNTAAVNQLIWDFGNTTNKIAAADETANSYQDMERTTILQADLTLRSAFYTAAADRDLVTVAEENLKNNEAHLEQTKAFVKAGTGAEIDVATSDASVANAEVQLITARNNYATAKSRLNQAMGVEGSTSYEIQPPPDTPLRGEDSPLDQLVDEGLATRPEQATLQAQLRADEYAMKNAFDSLFPTLFATVGGSFSGGSVAASTIPATATTPAITYPSTTELNPNVYLGLGVSWSVNIGPLAPATVRQYEAQRDQVAAQLDALHLQVRVDVETAQLAVKAGIEALQASHRALNAAKKQLDLAQGRYNAGVGSQIELGDAQVAADQAGAQDVNALYTLDTARAQLIEALGRM